MRIRHAFIVPVALVGLLAAPVALADPEPGTIDPSGRVTAWVPGDVGGERTIVLQYGPYVIGPGQDLSRVDVEVVGADGFVIAAKPALRYPDGLEPLNTEVHIHHAHWVWADPNAGGYNRWFFGTGEERTRGHVGMRALVEDDPHLGYGVQMRRGDPLLLVSMVHNKTAQPQTVWIEAEFSFVDGTPEEIASAPASAPPAYPPDRMWWGGRDFHALVPTLHGATFNVPRDPIDDPDGIVDGEFVYPHDLRANDPNALKGHVFTAPWDGTMIIGAVHLHGGGKTVWVENLGRADDPCPDDGTGFAGGTDILRGHAFYREVNGEPLSPSEDLQMGITKPGWRVNVRQGDRIAINGTYDTSRWAYWDAMSFFGWYTDPSTPGRGIGGQCAPTLLDGDLEHAGTDPVESIENRSWDLFPELTVCGVAGAAACERPRTFTPGPAIETISIGGFLYQPGDHALTGLIGSPTVARGQSLRFVNADVAMDVRHTVTSCPAPCSGPYVANYPQSDGLFDSAILGPDPLITNTYTTSTLNEETGLDVPMIGSQRGPVVWWDLDTTALEPATYTYFCRIHPWMRGSFMVT